MMKSKYTTSIILGLTTLLLMSDCRQHDKVVTDDNTVVLKVNDWVLNIANLNRRISNIEKLNAEYHREKAVRQAVDISVMIGLLVDEAYKRGFDKDKEILEKITIATAKQAHSERYRPHLDELRRAYKRQREKLRLGHVWVKTENQPLISRIVQQLRLGGSIENYGEIPGGNASTERT